MIAYRLDLRWSANNAPVQPQPWHGPVAEHTRPGSRDSAVCDKCWALEYLPHVRAGLWTAEIIEEEQQ